MSFDLSGYNTVPERMTEFFTRYPEGCLRQQNYELITIPVYLKHKETGEPYKAGERVFLAFTAAAYRTPDDPNPGLGTAWEPVPGTTPYTKDSEMMNAETSAWGRAILAVGAADTRKGIASREEVQSRRGE